MPHTSLTPQTNKTMKQVQFIKRMRMRMCLMPLLVSLTASISNAAVISVDFIQAGGTPCSGDTTLTGTTMKNADGNIFTGQNGSWNSLDIESYNNTSAISGFLEDGDGFATTAKLALGEATGLDAVSAGGWRCFPNTGASGGAVQLRDEMAYLYYPTITVNHFAWALTGLTPNAQYRLTMFGNGSYTYTNIANSVSGIPDSEGDWNWVNITANSSGVIAGNFSTSGNNQVYGLYGLQIQEIPEPSVLGLLGLSGIGLMRRRRN